MDHGLSTASPWFSRELLFVLEEGKCERGARQASAKREAGGKKQPRGREALGEVESESKNQKIKEKREWEEAK